MEMIRLGRTELMVTKNGFGALPVTEGRYGNRISYTAQSL